MMPSMALIEGWKFLCPSATMKSIAETVRIMYFAGL